MNHPIPLDPQTNKHKHIVNDSTKGSFGSYCNLNRHNVLDEINLVGSISCNADSGPQQWAGLLTAPTQDHTDFFFQFRPYGPTTSQLTAQSTLLDTTTATIFLPLLPELCLVSSASVCELRPVSVGVSSGQAL